MAKSLGFEFGMGNEALLELTVYLNAGMHSAFFEDAASVDMTAVDYLRTLIAMNRPQDVALHFLSSQLEGNGPESAESKRAARLIRKIEKGQSVARTAGSPKGKV